MRFVLIHGGFHGAWCWDRLIPEIGRLGHEAIAIDLPGHGERRDERSTLADRRDAILDVTRPGDVLVGHSGGGFDITLAADAAPERFAHLIYLAAGLPIEGRSVVEATGGSTARSEDGEEKVTKLLTDETGMLQFIRPNAQGRMEVVDFDLARNAFYHDCDDETAAWAFSKLSPAPVELLTEIVSVPRFWQADLPRSYILCKDDRAKPLSMSKHIIERLGVVPLVIEASHSPFLSRPAELAALFVQATATVPSGPLRPL